MKGHRHFAAVAAITATLLLAGCGGTDGAAAPAGSATAAPPPAAKAPTDGDRTGEKTMEQVLRDLHYAAKGIGEDHVRVMKAGEPAAAKLPPCQAHGTILTREVPGRAELLLLTGHLRKRGWVPDGSVQDDITTLSSGTWNILLAAGPVPKELAAQVGPDKGSIALSATRVCEKLP